MKTPVKITARYVEAATFMAGSSVKSPDYRWDSELKGFGLRIYPTGRKVFVLSYRNSSHKKRFANLGAYPAIKAPQARKIAEDYLHKIAQGNDPQAEKQSKRTEMTLNQYADEYLEQQKDHKKSHHDDVQRYRDHIRPILGEKRLSEITVADMNKWQTGLLKKELSKSTANRCVALIKHSFKLAVEKGYVSESPARNLKLYKEPEPRDIVLSVEEFWKVYDACGEDENIYAGALFRLAMFTGRRTGELLNTKWDDYDANSGCIVLHDTKAGERQYIYPNDEAMAVLNDLPRMVGNPYIFAGKAFGKPLNNYAKAWRRVIARAGVPYIPPHGLRHSYTSMMMGSGLPTEVIGKLVGHKNAATTRKYMHHRPDGLRETAKTFSKVVDIGSTKKK